LEKIVCNIVANPNIRYIVLCGRESAGHLPGESLLALMQNGVTETKQIIGTEAPTPHLYNIPMELIERFRAQIISVINLLCQSGEKDTGVAGLDAKVIENAVRSCYQEEPVSFMGYELYDTGAYPQPAMFHKIASKLGQPQQDILQPGKSRLAMGLVLHRFLPKTNCRECGKRTCLAFAIELGKGNCQPDECPIMSQAEFAADRQALAKLLEKE
jgi:hypothetical protein